MDYFLNARDLAAVTLKCLVRLCVMPESKVEDYHEKWLKKLDHLIAGFEAESPPTDVMLIETGILETSEP